MRSLPLEIMIQSGFHVCQVDVQQPERVDNWRWADLDLRLLLQQFRGLKVTQQYKQTQMQLTALGPEGQAPLARVQMEMLGKVVNDFLAQLGAQLSSLPAAAEATPGMTESGTDTQAEGSWSKPAGVDGGPGLGKGLAKGRGGIKMGAGRGELGGLTSSQVKKKTGLQQKREQLKAGKACVAVIAFLERRPVTCQKLSCSFCLVWSVQRCLHLHMK